MRAGNLVSARLLARKGIVDPTDFTSLLAWRLEHGNKAPEEPDVPDVPDVPAELLSWEGVAYHIEQGDYKDVYKIGDEIPLDLGSEGLIHMQVAAFDADDLADGSGKAPITFIAKELLKTKKRMNPSRSGSSGAYTEGTGAIGGWEKCEMRTYLQNTIRPLVPEDVLSIIVPIINTQNAYDTTGTKIAQTTIDDVWLPSKSDVGATGTSQLALIKNLFGADAAADWWLRDGGSGSTQFMKILTTGAAVETASATNTLGVCIGFCVGKTPT